MDRSRTGHARGRGPAALVALLLALPACSQVLDFTAFRFTDERDAGAADAVADVTGDLAPVMDAPVMDAPVMALRSCADHLRAGRTASGMYPIDSDGDVATPPVTVYCDQVREGGGWQRVIDLSNGLGCPPSLVSDARERVCVRRAGPGETVTVFRITPEVPYSEVRGLASFRARGALDGFDNPAAALVPDGPFVDGLTVSRVVEGDGRERREHVFTWALTDSAPPERAPSAACPCAGGHPAFPAVGDRYLCRALIDRGRDGGASSDGPAWRDPETPWLLPAVPCAPGDPDGWFRTTLGSAVRAPLDVRLTISGGISDAGSSEEVGLASLELYVR
nr:hypothetical protein [Deltaproteobacteria bacterium]